MIRDLLKKSRLELLVGKLPAANVVQLTWQRRMPAAIADFMLWRLRAGPPRTGPVLRRRRLARRRLRLRRRLPARPLCGQVDHHGGRRRVVLDDG